MHVWVIAISEPLPSIHDECRLLRAGTITKSLLDHGHSVTWWSSGFDHTSKKVLFRHDVTLKVSSLLELHLLSAIPYNKNVSLVRLASHFILSQKFRRAITSCQAPELIISAFPTIELCTQAVAFGSQRGIPVVIDVRDLWPDALIDVLPSATQAVARVCGRPLVRMTREALSGASGIMAVSEGYLDWALKYAGRSRRSSDQVFTHGYEVPSFSDSELNDAEKKLELMGVRPDAFICWFVGTFGATYDLGTIIEAARRVYDLGRHDVQFVLSGDGPRRNEWVTAASGLKNVVFTGRVDRCKLLALMRVAKIGLAAYTRTAPQGLPFKLFEYMAGGVPILSSLRGEAERFINANGCGMTYEAGSAAELLSALIRLINDPSLRERMSANALRAHREHYSSSAIYQRMVGYLEEICRASH